MSKVKKLIYVLDDEPDILELVRASLADAKTFADYRDFEDAVIKWQRRSKNSENGKVLGLELAEPFHPKELPKHLGFFKKLTNPLMKPYTNKPKPKINKTISKIFIP